MRWWCGRSPATIGGVLYDLRDKNDRMMLGFQAVQAEWLADSIRDNVLRGIVGAAEAGRPAR
jgi:site-specific DNA recombinase